MNNGFIIFAVCIIISSTCVMDEYDQSGEQIIFIPEAYDQPFPHNPFKGWVAWGKSPDYDGYTQPYSMLYARVFWAQVEPQKHEFNWLDFEREWHFNAATENTKIILRVVLDNPGEHLPGMNKDIPDWLFEEMAGSGTFYATEGQGDTDIGNGFSPDYTDPELIKEHERFITALGNRYNNDPRIAFIQIGSLGHWGEWHTWPEGTGDFPPYETASRYVTHYTGAFPDKLLLIRRPLQYHAGAPLVGVYNDVIGDNNPWATPRWLAMITGGYTSEWDNEFHPPLVTGWWHHAPSGGELASHPAGVNHWLEGDNFGITLQQLKDAHTSWIGPSSPGRISNSTDCQTEIDHMLMTMGYRFVITKIMYSSWIKAGGILSVTLIIENQGVAPLYYNWPLEITLSEDDHIIFSHIAKNIDVRRWLPGFHEVKLDIRIPHDLAPGTRNFGIALIDPLQNRPAIEFAIDQSLRRQDGRYLMGQVYIR
jgi:hypothetical protein